MQMSEFITGKLQALFLAAVLLPSVHAQFIQQGSKLVGSGAAGSPSQGSAVAVSADGNTAIVGGDFDNGAAGAAWVYVRANGVWSQQGPKLVGTGAGGNSGQGYSVAISADGNTAMVGGPGVGAVWVYTRTNGVWSQQGPKLAGTGAVTTPGLPVSNQGSSVALSADGNTAVVGASADDFESESTAGGTIGAVWVFTRTNGVWTQQGPKLVGAGAVGFPDQGTSAAISADGNTAIVGGEGDDGVGAAWIYTRTNGVWSQQGPKLVGTGAVDNAAQGISVGLSADGNTAVVGGSVDNRMGAMWVYTRTNGVWSQQGPKLVGTGAVGVAGQGISVAVSGDGNTALSGGPGDDRAEGAVWVFTRTNGVWSQQGSKLVGTGALGTPGFSAPNQGNSVAISADGHTAIVGGPSDQPVGAAWVFVSAPVHLMVSAPASVTAGTPFSFIVTALDTNNSIVTGYTGTVHFSTTDPIGNVPADSLVTNGVSAFTATLKSSNSLSPMITATDTVNSLITGNSAPIGVQAAAASRFAFSATPALAISGAPFNFTVSAFDPFGNLASPRVRFTSSDGAAILPAESFMPAGVATFLAVLKTAGSQTITVTDTGNSSTTGTSNPIVVTGSSTSFNLSQGKAATQSSTFPGYATDGASSAVDGNTDGNFGDGSVTATAFEDNPWWQVDLGFSANINAIVIWNRTDCCGSRLNNYWVFVSDTPFLPTDTPTSLNRAGTFSIYQTSAPNPSTIIAAAGAHGRYVRVQIEMARVFPPPGPLPNPLPAVTFGTNILSLAEVQVFGTGSSLAQGRTATQSSTFPGYASAAASSAVDGNTDGSFFDGSVTATNLDTNAWWQVDLGASASISSIVIWNRTDCCSSRLSDYWVFVSNTPFLPTDTPATLQSRPGTFASRQTTAPNPSALITFASLVAVSGRYVRVQLSGTDYLSLAEVLVFGTGGAPPPTNVALGKSAAQSSTFPGYATDGAASAVDGNTDGNFGDGSVTATNLDPNPWWQVDLGTSTAVSSIVIWDRTDCCSSRLGDYWVFVSDTPFLPTDTPATLQSRLGTFSSHQTSAPNPSTTIAAGAQGRYVRVQLSSANYLSLAEVQVFGQ
jgi:hypothetical protein